MKTRTLTAFLAVMLLTATSVFAASPWTMEDTYGEKVAGKLDFGVKNLLGGWMAILPCKSGCDMEDKNAKPYCPVVCTKKLVKGLVNSVVYTVGGALHVVTFPVPVDIPLPNNGIQI